MQKQQFKRLLVGLDLTEADTTLLSYLGNVLPFIPAESIYFLHVHPTLISDQSHEVLDEKIAQAMREKVEGYLNTTSFEVHFDVREGNPAEEILKWSSVKKTDVIFLVNRIGVQGSGLLQDLANKSNASLWMVPEGYDSFQFTKFYLPLQFNEHNAHTIRLAYSLDEADEGYNMFVCEHLYEIPTGYRYSGKSKEEYTSILARQRQEDFKNFIADHNLDALDLTCNMILAEKESVAQKIYAQSRKMGADLIMISGRGRSKVSSFLLGSVTNELILLDPVAPLILVKNPKGNMGIWEAIQEI